MATGKELLFTQKVNGPKWKLKGARRNEYQQR